MRSRALAALHGDRVLVTGAAGSIGSALVRVLEGAGVEVRATDIDTFDVRRHVTPIVGASSLSVVFHLAGAKHAPDGEVDPWDVLETNAVGTRNVLELAAAHGARVVLASTGKAADPETAYGASKLIAERMTLNAGGSVARFFNVRESSGNVFRIWESVPADEPLPVSPCSRFFISLEQAVELLLWAAVLEPGRYVADPGERRSMFDVAAEVYPGRARAWMEPRRGDRMVEPLHAVSERVDPTGVDGVLQVVSPHDAAVPVLAAAA